MNLYAVRAIYVYEMARTGRTLFQSVVSPVISTSLYFIVFGAAIGSRITQIDGVSYGSFIVPGLIMLMLLTQSVTNASFGIYFPRFVGTIYELLSAPVSAFEIVLGYVGAAATKSIVLGLIILATSGLFVPLHIAHPFWMLAFLVLTAVSFSLFGFILGLWAERLREIADRAAAHHHAADVSRRHVLFDQRVAAVLAHGDAVRSAGLSDLGLPLELFRHRRRQRRSEPGDDARLPRHLHVDRLVVLQDRVPVEELIDPCLGAALRPGNVPAYAGFACAIASAIATVRRAISACSRSTMRPSIWMTPLSLFSG